MSAKRILILLGAGVSGIGVAVISTEVFEISPWLGWAAGVGWGYLLCWLGDRRQPSFQLHQSKLDRSKAG